MPNLRTLGPAAAALVLVLGSACTGAPAPEAADQARSGSAPAVTAPAAEPARPDVAPTESVTEDFDAPVFGDPTRIDNRWLPLTPGTHWVWEGEATVDGERIARRVELTITDLTKVIEGVRTVVGYELDFNEDQLIEAELLFVAQDDNGNVWHLGQYPEEYEDGVFVAAPAWIHNFQGANAGIFMKAEPQLGTPDYSKGWGPAVDWTDRAHVSQMGLQTCVAAGCYRDVLVTAEFNRSQPDAEQLKFYAPAIGNVRVDWAGALEVEQEVLDLVLREQLDEAGMADIRAKALALEEHAYAIDHEVYKYTAPMEPAV